MVISNHPDATILNGWKRIGNYRLSLSVAEKSADRQEYRGVAEDWLVSMRGTSRIEFGGGKTSVQSRRFSSSKPTRLADGLGPKRFTLHRLVIRPEELDPPFSVSEIRLTLWVSYSVVSVKAILKLRLTFPANVEWTKKSALAMIINSD
jgi:hypothetical protein